MVTVVLSFDWSLMEGGRLLGVVLDPTPILGLNLRPGIVTLRSIEGEEGEERGEGEREEEVREQGEREGDEYIDESIIITVIQ